MSWMEFTIAITAILVGGLVVLVPALALAARYAFKPLVESWKAQGRVAAPPAVEHLDRRQLVLEQSVRSIEATVGRLREEVEFSRALREGGAEAKGTDRP